MVSKTDICNSALLDMGASPSLMDIDTDDDALSRLFRVQYPIIRDQVLSDHPWNFAKKKRVEPAMGEAPAFKWPRQFKLPADYLRLWKIDEEKHRNPDYEVVARTIQTDAASPLHFEYIAQIEQTGLFSAAFVQTLAAGLAAKLAYKITDSRTMAEQLEALYRAKLAEARARDGMEATSELVWGESWLVSRRSGTGF